jgi:hypothetical protein
MFPAEGSEMSDNSTAHENGCVYWPWFPAAAALAGIIVFIFATYGPPASSSGFVSALKGMWLTVNPEYAEGKAHYYMIADPGSWLFAFVLGMALGGFIGGRTIKRTIDDIPAIWKQKYGNNSFRRYAATFIGGFLILFGARLAGGCTLGLFMSGSIQLTVSGIYFGILIFLSAMFTARIVYRKKATEEDR